MRMMIWEACLSMSGRNSCKSTGGPCVYTGRDMKTAHAGARITKADWDRSLKIFGEVLSKFKVPDKEQQELAALLIPLEKDIVEK